MSDLGYKNFRRDELEYQFNPRVSVPEYPQLARKRSDESREVRATHKSWLNVSYGRSPREVLDIYPAGQPASPVLVYIHGGYWRSGSKDDNCNFVPAFTQHGASVALLEYDLCPNVTVTDIVRQTRAAMAWVYRKIARENNPFLHPPLAVCPLLVTVGGAEPEGWKQMSKDYFQFCEDRGAVCEYLEVPGANHYTMSDHLADATSPLTQAIFRQMGL